MLFVGPHQPYLAYVADVLPSLGEEGVQTCTLRDLVAEGATAAAIETDPAGGPPKSSVNLVKAIEPAVRFYEAPPSKPMTVETPWSDIRLTADDWAEAFDAPEPGAPHNEAREQIWQALLTILIDRQDGEAPADLLRKSLEGNRELRATLNSAWPLVEAADLVADLWSVPAYLRKCALGSARRRPGAATREHPPLDDVRPAAAGCRTAAARRPGGGSSQPSSARRRRRPRGVDGTGRRAPHRIRRFRDGRDVHAARSGPAEQPDRRG